jgi:pectate lyase
MNVLRRWPFWALVLSCCLATGPARAQDSACVPASGPRERPTDIGRDTLPPNDGWASTSPGTTGGSAAVAPNIFTVTNRQELAAALGPSGSTTPRLIYVEGTIDGNVDNANNPLTCADYALGTGYTLAQYLVAYDPATWGRVVPTGPMETARANAALAQRARMRLDVRSNTTIVGVGITARLKGINLRLPGVSNVIIRNLRFEDAFDCFPAWDPTDGALGNWNSAYDNISIVQTGTTGSSRVWIDHNSFTDGDHPDSTQPPYFGRPFQWHDGEVDITNGSDLVTVSWNRFTDHDKTMLIGSSDGAGATDRNRLRVTIHHNYFANAGQRTPRDRFGQLHVYNNYYEVLNSASSGAVPSYQYSWGVGVESQIFAENNAFRTRGITPDQIIRRFSANPPMLHATGTVINGPDQAVDVVAAYNAVNSPPLTDVNWTPSLFVAPIDPAANVPALVTCVKGDVTRNGWIQCDDLSSVAEAVGTHIQPGSNPVRDLNGDGVVDVRDLAVVSQNLPEATTCAQ